MDGYSLDKLWRYDEVDATIDSFKAVLQKVGGQIESGSLLEQGCLVLRDFRARHDQLARGEQHRPWPTMYADLSLAAGVLNLAGLTVDLQNHRDFRALVPHLRLLNAGMPAQTTRASVTDEASNKLFELRFALACMRHGTGLLLDDPDRSSGGANPDIICRMSDGRKWGFACKVIHSANPKTVADRFFEAVDQIERSGADIGLPVLSFKNHLPYDKIMPVLAYSSNGDPILGAHRSEDAPVSLAADEIMVRIHGMQLAATDDGLKQRLHGKKAVTAIASPVDFVALMAPAAIPVLGLFNFLRIVELNYLNLPRPFDEHAWAIANDINHGLARRGTL